MGHVGYGQLSSEIEQDARDKPKAMKTSCTSNKTGKSDFTKRVQKTHVQSFHRGKSLPVREKHGPVQQAQPVSRILTSITTITPITTTATTDIHLENPENASPLLRKQDNTITTTTLLTLVLLMLLLLQLLVLLMLS